MTPRPFVVLDEIPERPGLLVPSNGRPRIAPDTVVYEYQDVTYGCIGGDEIAVTLNPGETPFHGVPRDSVEELTHLPQLDDQGNATDYALCDIDGGLIATNSGRANCVRCRDWWDNHNPNDDKADD